jgi:hypothetical protein
LFCIVCITAVATKEKSPLPEEVAPKAAGKGTEAGKNYSPSKHKAMAIGERKAALSPAKKDMAMVETKPKGRKAPARKQVKGKGNKKNVNKQQRRKQNGRNKPSPTEPDVPAKAEPKVKGKKKQQTTTEAPVYEDDVPADVQYPDAKDDDQTQDYDYTEEPERHSQKPRKRGRRPPPRVIIVVRDPPPPQSPRQKFPFLQPTPGPGQYFPYNPFIKHGPPQNYYSTTPYPTYAPTSDFQTTGMEYYWQTTLPPGSNYYSSDYQGGPVRHSTDNPNYPYYQTTYYPYYTTGTNNYYQFWTTYYPKYNWTNFYHDEETKGYNYYYTTIPPWRNDEYNQTQYYNNQAYRGSSSLPGYFPNYNWTSIYGTSDMPYNGAQNYSQPSMFKNSTETTPEPSTKYPFMFN